MVSAEQMTALLGLVLVKNGGDVRIPIYQVNEGLPSKSKVAVFWDGDDLVVGIRPEDWEQDEL